MNQLKRLFTFFVIITASQLSLLAQNTLQQQYQEILDNTETFERYKVIPRTTLDNLFNQVTDSVGKGLQTIKKLNSQITSQQAQIDSLRKSLNEIKTQLSASEEVNDTIYFLGIPFNKIGYHILVWGIIAALAFLGIVAYFMYLRSNNVTSSAKRELQSVKSEFETHKDKSREQQVRLKRELQTAVNTIDEMKRGKRG